MGCGDEQKNGLAKEVSELLLPSVVLSHAVSLRPRHGARYDTVKWSKQGLDEVREAGAELLVVHQLRQTGCDRFASCHDMLAHVRKRCFRPEFIFRSGEGSPVQPAKQSQ